MTDGLINLGLVWLLKTKLLLEKSWMTLNPVKWTYMKIVDIWRGNYFKKIWRKNSDKFFNSNVTIEIFLQNKSLNFHPRFFIKIFYFISGFIGRKKAWMMHTKNCWRLLPITKPFILVSIQRQTKLRGKKNTFSFSFSLFSYISSFLSIFVNQKVLAIYACWTSKEHFCIFKNSFNFSFNSSPVF